MTPRVFHPAYRQGRGMDIPEAHIKCAILNPVEFRPVEGLGQKFCDV